MLPEKEPLAKGLLPILSPQCIRRFMNSLICPFIYLLINLIKLIKRTYSTDSQEDDVSSSTTEENAYASVEPSKELLIRLMGSEGNNAMGKRMTNILFMHVINNMLQKHWQLAACHRRTIFS